MKLSVISSLALAAAMLAAPGVYAQDAAASPTMIGSQSISADDLPKVQAQCATLAGVEGGSLIDDNDESDDESATDDNDDADQNSSTSDEANKTAPTTADEVTSAVNLELITLEECRAAGLAQ